MEKIAEKAVQHIPNNFFFYLEHNERSRIITFVRSNENVLVASYLR